ncbi:hypothetical protein MASR2M78_00310 [Treponema sp.]
MSLALVLGSLGDFEGSRSYVQRAVAKFPDDERVLYYSAYLDATSGRLDAASRFLRSCPWS